MTQLPPLYTIDAKGKERVWKVSVDGNTIYRETGLVEGKRIESERSFNGKNIGRSNETTPEEQAMQEAEKEWVKQLEKNYAPKCKEGKAMYEKVMKVKNESGGHNINASAQIRGRKTKNVAVRKSFAVPKVEIEVRPMKAEKWELEDEKDICSVKAKVLKNINLEKGVYCQPKYDGWRCIARLQTGHGEGEYDVVLTSLSSKQYPWFGKLRDEVRELLRDNPDVILDGELYAHSIHSEDPSLITSKDGKEMDNFGIIQSICTITSKTPHPLEDQIKLHIFDIVDLTGKLDQKSRFQILNSLFDNDVAYDHLVKTPFKTAKSIDDVIKNLDHFVDKGYEGLIIRDRLNFYKTKGRSLQMRKVKYFTDKEYKIVGTHLDYGVTKENFVWVCEDEEGNEVRAKPTGSVESRVRMYKSRDDYIGKLATVKLQNYSGNGIPRFPICKGIRHPEDYLPC